MTFSYSQQIVSSAIPDDFESVGACCLGMNRPIRPDKLLEPVLPPAVDGSYLHGSDRSIESRRLKIEENDVGLNVTRGHSYLGFQGGSEIYFIWNILWSFPLFTAGNDSNRIKMITELFEYAQNNYKFSSSWNWAKFSIFSFICRSSLISPSPIANFSWAMPQARDSGMILGRLFFRLLWVGISPC